MFCNGMIFFSRTHSPNFSDCFRTKRLVRPIWKGLGGKTDLSVPTAMRPALLIDLPIVLAAFVVVIANIIRI
jgi:hypothetical protein